MGHWAASPDPSGSQKCIFFPWPNGLLMELAYLYLTQKIPKWYGNREISSQLVVGLVVVGGNLVINLLPFTSSRIDSEETKRKRRGRGRKKPCVSDHLGKLKETRLNCLYLHQSCLTMGDHRESEALSEVSRELWAFTVHLLWTWLFVYVTAFGLYSLSVKWAYFTHFTVVHSFTHSFFVESPLERQQWTRDSLPSWSILSSSDGETWPKSSASIHTWQD